MKNALMKIARWFGWRVAGGIALFAAVCAGILYGLAALFGGLFQAWGLTETNLLRAPTWARAVAAYHADFCYLCAYIGAAVAGGLYVRRLRGRARANDLRRAALGFGIGIFAAAGLTALALLTDSMRLELPLSEGRFGLQTVTSLAVLVAGRISGEVLTKCVIFDLMEKKSRAWALALSTVAAALLSGACDTVIGAITALLLGYVSCVLYVRGGIFASSALQVGWSAWCTALFGFPGMGSVSPVWTLYHVSDAWLTGGNGSVLGGAWFLTIFAAAALFLSRKKIATFAKDRAWRGRKENL